MTYRREVEKAVKSYLLPLGFKYRPKTYNFFRRYSDEITQDIGFAYETHGRSHYYFMRTFIGVNSMSLNKILFEVTDGIVDYRADTHRICKKIFTEDCMFEEEYL